MDGITVEITLLFIILVLLCVTLFLGVMNAIFLSKLFHVISRQWMRSESGKPFSQPKRTVAQKVDIPSSKVDMAPAEDISQARDISDGLRIICELYGLDALTISSTDGLALGSYGTESSAAEAARFSHLYAVGEEISDTGVEVSQMDYQGSPLLAIIRKKETITSGLLDDIENHVRRLLNKWL